MSKNPIIDGIIEAEQKPTNGKDPVTGRFLPGNKPITPGRRAQAYLEHKLSEVLPNHAHSANDEMIAWMIELATGCPSLGDGAQRYKYAKESIWAYRALTERAYGNVIKDQSELDAIAKGGTVFVLVPQPVSIDVTNVPAALPEAQPVFEPDPQD
jgi:hypothetical protein